MRWSGSSEFLGVKTSQRPAAQRTRPERVPTQRTGPDGVRLSTIASTFASSGKPEAISRMGVHLPLSQRHRPRFVPTHRAEP